MHKLLFIGVFLTTCIAGLAMIPLATSSRDHTARYDAGGFDVAGSAHPIARPPSTIEAGSSIEPPPPFGATLSTSGDLRLQPEVTHKPSIEISSPRLDSSKIVEKWMPRLTDRSIDLREEAVERLAAVAEADPNYRDILVSTLIDACRTEETQRIRYHLFDALAEFPQGHPEWVDPMLDLYIEFGNKYCDNIMYHFVFRDLWRLIESGRVRPSHPRYGEVIELAKAASQYGESEARAVGVKILDISDSEE